MSGRVALIILLLGVLLLAAIWGISQAARPPEVTQLITPASTAVVPTTPLPSPTTAPTALPANTSSHTM